MVVSQGPDFILNVTPSGSINVPYMGTATINVTATALNGFNDRIDLQLALSAGYSYCFGLISSAPSLTPNSQGEFIFQNGNCPGSSPYYAQYQITGTATSIGVSHTAYNGPTLDPFSGSGFAVTVGLPSAPALPVQGSVTYPVTVTSIGGLGGTVNLSLAPPQGSGMPAGVTSQFSSPAYLPSGGTATSTLTLTGSASTPGGTFPLVATGTLQGGSSQTANFSLGTQVTTFQVTSATGGAIVHNTGQEVQVTHNVPAGSVPSNSTCESADPEVTCRVISSSAGTVTLGITGSTRAPHGLHVLSLNAGGTMLHTSIADSGVGSLPDVEVQAGQADTEFLALPLLNCDFNGIACPVSVRGPGWIDILSATPYSAELYFHPPITTRATTYSYSVDLCSGFWDPGNESPCDFGSGTATVDAPAPPAVRILRPFFITPTSTAWQYTSNLTSSVSPTGGCYQWSTNNPSMVTFSTSPTAGNITLLSSTNDKATITLSYTVPCGSENSATDTLTFALTNDTTVVAWVDPNSPALLNVPIPPSDPFGNLDPVFNNLVARGAISCGLTLLGWADGGKNGKGTANNNLTSAEIGFANAFLLEASGNKPNPPSQFDPDQISFVNNPSRYRLYQRLQAYYQVTSAGTILNPTYLMSQATPGVTPEPCTGFQIFSKPVEDNKTLNGKPTATADGTLVYQVVEARLGDTGQQINQFLNGLLNISYTTATPWIWSVVQFDANGKTRAWTQGGTSDNLSIFPAYQIYTNGFTITNPTLPNFGLYTIMQLDPGPFIAKNSSFQYQVPQ